MAGKKFSELNVATEANGSDLIAAAQDKGGGALETRKLTLSQLRTWLQVLFDDRFARLNEDVVITGRWEFQDALKNALRVPGHSHSLPGGYSGHVDLQGGTGAKIHVGDGVVLHYSGESIGFANYTGGSFQEWLFRVPAAGGMPMMGSQPIVESGNSASGSWIKFADETMMCVSAEGHLDAVRSTISFGSLYRSGGSDYVDWNFPQAFVSAPMVYVGAGPSVIGTNGSPSSTKVNIGMISSSNSSGPPSYFGALAWGRRA